jgi:SAM-dependent methyltransferase
MTHPSTDRLHPWIPRLLQAWRRRQRSAPGPARLLTATEAERVALGVRRLSAGLTGERQLAGEHYLSDPDLLGAYLLYFWPLSYLQAMALLQALPLPPRSVLDLGSGPGPMAAAAYDLGARRVTCADRSRPALALAGELLKTAGALPELLFWDPLHNGALPAGTFDLIILGHVVNELWTDRPDRLTLRAGLVQSLGERLTAGGSLLLIEPALTSTSREALALRDELLQRGFRVAEPCLWQGPCPALAMPRDTCHGELAWSPPPWLRDLIRRAGFKKRTLKQTALLFQAGTAPAAGAGPEVFRIVSDPLRSKNRRLRLLGCGPAGRLSLALKPGSERDGNRIFLTLRRGDLIRLVHAAPRPGGLDILPETRVSLLHRAGA